jgi:hypothetical protein
LRFPKYYLLTANNAAEGAVGAPLDSAAAKEPDFSQQQIITYIKPGRNHGQYGAPSRMCGQRMTVTFDLSPFRGKTVKLTFEADNCIPGGHFAYTYIALRNRGIKSISGDPIACTNAI